MNRKFFARSFRSAIPRISMAATLLVSLPCPAVHAQTVYNTTTALKLSQPGAVASGAVETLTATPTIPFGTGYLKVSQGLVTFYDGKTVLTPSRQPMRASILHLSRTPAARPPPSPLP
jgi:hypothetical protein